MPERAKHTHVQKKAPASKPLLTGLGNELLSPGLSPNQQLVLLLQTFAVIPTAIVVVNSHAQIAGFNPALLKLTGFASAELSEKHLAELTGLHPQMAFFVHLMKSHTSRASLYAKYRTQKRSGQIYWEEATLKYLTHSGLSHYILGFFQDITTQVQSKELISHMAFYDLLTDLPNRMFFSGELEYTLKQASSSKQRVAVVLLDLDRFKIVNDTLGHAVGDQLIQNVALRLRDKLAPRDTLARMGGDEFMLLLPYIHDFKEISDKVLAIKEMFSLPFEFNRQKLHINVSMGISLFPEDGRDVQSLLKHADAALHEAKTSGRNHHKFYTADLRDNAFNELAIEMSLRQALEHNHFQLHYQPQVSLLTGKIIGVEALVRWNDPEIGIIMPDSFIPLAEETGLIVPLGNWVLQEACLQNMVWQKAGLPPIKVAVNMSVRQFQEPELVENILDICKKTGLDPHWLDLEITESLLMRDLAVTQMILQWLLKKGITITLDDFGTGYSSLRYLQSFPIHAIKIDRSFIRDSQTNAENAALVTTICAIAKNLNMQVIAEGVENPEQLDFVTKLACDSFQGYFFSRPIPAQQMTDLLHEGRCIPISAIRTNP